MSAFLRTRTWQQWLIAFGVVLAVVAVCANDLYQNDLPAMLGFLTIVGVACVVAGMRLR